MKLHIAVLSLLAYALMLGAISIAPLLATPTIQVKVRYLPEWVSLKGYTTWGFYAFITPPSPYNPSDINPETILLEGVLAPTWTKPSPSLFVAEFDSDAFMGIVWARIFHLPLPGHLIYLRITGEFKDGTPFDGTGKITVLARG